MHDDDCDAMYYEGGICTCDRPYTADLDGPDEPAVGDDDGRTHGPALW